MPTGMYKVVVGCGFNCSNPLKFYSSDQEAAADGVPAGQKYALKQSNAYGLLYGFVKGVYANFNNDSLRCDTVLQSFSNDQDALLGGLQLGDYYQLSASNDYGAPAGCVRVVSTASMTEADAHICCSGSATLQYFDSDAQAIAGGLAVGEHYFLSASNVYGWPAGAQKRVQ
jgi:hypothetical protein